MVSTDNLAWTYCFLHLMACVERPKILLQNIHNPACIRLYGVLTQTTLQILTTVCTSNPVPKIIKNWNVNGNITLGKLNYRTAVYIYIYFTQCIISLGPGSVVGIATGYGLEGPGIESRWGGEIFRTCPDRPRGPPSLLYNGYQVFPGGKERPGRDADPTSLSSAVIMKG